MSDTAPDTTPKKGRQGTDGAGAPRQQVAHDDNPEAQGQGEGWAGTNPDEGEVEEIVPTEPAEPVATKSVRNSR